MPAPLTPTNRRLLSHSHHGHEPSSSLQSSPLPDASEISPASSGALSPQSSSSSGGPSPSGDHHHHHRPSDHTAVYGADARCVQRAVQLGAHHAANSDDFPLVSREPSRGPSKSSLRSVDPTSMHAEEARSKPRAHRSTRRPSHESDTDVGRAVNLSASSTPSSRSSLSCESVSEGAGPRHFLNNAAKQQYLDECRRRERLRNSQEIWAQQVANKRKYHQPELEKKERSALQHRLFNLKVRQLRHQDGVTSAIHSNLVAQQGTPNVVRAHHREGLSSTPHRGVGRSGASKEEDDVGGAAPRGIAFSGLQKYLFDDYVHIIVPQQLTWIGQSGERGRSGVPPMMQLVSRSDSSVVLGARGADGGGRTPRGDNTHRASQHKRDEARELQEAKWFQAAQRQFHR